MGPTMESHSSEEIESVLDPVGRRLHHERTSAMSSSCGCMGHLT